MSLKKYIINIKKITKITDNHVFYMKFKYFIRKIEKKIAYLNEYFFTNNINITNLIIKINNNFNLLIKIKLMIEKEIEEYTNFYPAKYKNKITKFCDEILIFIDLIKYNFLFISDKKINKYNINKELEIEEIKEIKKTIF